MPPRRERTKHFLNCFCGRKPLLAVYGIDEQGDLYVHVMVYKRDRLYGEVYVTRGNIKLRCRECLRWHEVVIKESGTAVLEESTVPEPIANPPTSTVDQPAPVTVR